MLEIAVRKPVFAAPAHNLSNVVKMEHHVAIVVMVSVVHRSQYVVVVLNVFLHGNVIVLIGDKIGGNAI